MYIYLSIKLIRYKIVIKKIVNSLENVSTYEKLINTFLSDNWFYNAVSFVLFQVN